MNNVEVQVERHFEIHFVLNCWFFPFSQIFCQSFLFLAGWTFLGHKMLSQTFWIAQNLLVSVKKEITQMNCYTAGSPLIELVGSVFLFSLPISLPPLPPGVLLRNFLSANQNRVNASIPLRPSASYFSFQVGWNGAGIVASYHNSLPIHLLNSGWSAVQTRKETLLHFCLGSRHRWWLYS